MCRRYNGLFQIEGRHDLPHKMDESIFLLARSPLFARCARNIPQKISKPIFFQQKSVRKNYFFSQKTVRKIFFYQFTVKNVFPIFFLLFTYFSIIILVNYTKYFILLHIFFENSRPLAFGLRPAIFSGTPRNFEAV